MGTFDQQHQHPITPPPELFRQWEGMPRSLAFEAAYRAGADAELEACVKWMLIHLHAGSNLSRQLRAARRPKPPSLAEEALAALNEIEDRYAGPSTQEILVRRALERLQELENND